MIYRYYIPALAWALVILLATSIPSSSIPLALRLGVRDLDKLIHFLLFAVHGGLLAFAFYKQPFKASLHRHHILLALVVGFLFGVITEAVQHYFISSRYGEVLDIVANFFGTVFGVVLFKAISSIGKKN